MKKKIYAIRCEDKNEWERRVPLIPDDVKYLKDKFGIKAIVEPSMTRIFPDQEFGAVGAELANNFKEAGLIMGIKEMPISLFEKNKTYMFFSHTIKGQPYNMPSLKALMEKKCNLIDYERIVDEKNNRLIFFGRYAGIAGMIETLHAYNQKLKVLSIKSPFLKIKQGFEYASLDNAKEELVKISKTIQEKGLPAEITPLVIGITGYGNVSRGVQEMLNLLPIIEITPQQLLTDYPSLAKDTSHIYKVVFMEKDLVKSKKGVFDLSDYYAHPENYESCFSEYFPYLTMLVNCIYWTKKYPRLLTRDYLRQQKSENQLKKLQVIGDISCDINGSIEITYKTTRPDNPCYTFVPETDEYVDGIKENGICVMSIDNLPCEFSKEASIEFSSVLKKYIKDIIYTDYATDWDSLKLPLPIKRALIVHKGALTPDYQYLQQFII
jgi:alpha-aminoadipic semialdehyde synthase